MRSLITTTVITTSLLAVAISNEQTFTSFAPSLCSERGACESHVDNVDFLQVSDVDVSFELRNSGDALKLEAAREHARVTRPHGAWNCNMNDECNTRFVNSYGFLTAMDVRPAKPDNDAPTVELDDYVGKIGHGSTVYVISSSLPDFIERVWPTIPRNVSFVLVTGAAVTSVPFDYKKGGKGGRPLSWTQREFEQFIEDPRIIHWFTQNCVAKHPKLTAIPIGLDYRWLNRASAAKRRIDGHAWGELMTPQAQERELLELKKSSAPWMARDTTLYADFHAGQASQHSDIRKDDRNQAKALLIQRKDVQWQFDRMDRNQVWQQYLSHKFIVSPLGVGLDCYRTWEALMLGSVPIVIDSDFVSDEMFKGLPVAKVHSWSNLNMTALEAQVAPILAQTPEGGIHEKLTLRFWLAKIVATAVVGSM